MLGADVRIAFFRKHRDVLSCAILLLIALAICSGGWSNGFLENWDDPPLITDNPDIQGITPANLYNIFTRYYLNTYVPMQMLSYMLDHAVWGFNPLGFLLMNAALHGLSGILLYLLLRRLKFPPGWALFASLLFVVHPVQVESVAWLSQRKTVLAMVFFLGAILQYLSFAEQRERPWRHYALSLIFFVLAFCAKTVVVILPIVLVGYDLLLRERRPRLAVQVVEKTPFFLLALGGALIPAAYQRAEVILGGSLPATVMTMLTVYKGYLALLFWPLQLSAEYYVAIKYAFDTDVLAAVALLVLSVAVILLVGRERRKEALFWLAVYFAGFLPVSQIVPFDHLMNDRYLYFPMLGFVAVVTLVLRQGVERFTLSRRAAPVAGGVLLLVLALASWQRTGVWRDGLTLWRDAVAKQPGLMLSWLNLGNVYEIAGDYQQAMTHYRKAASLDASSYEIHYMMGTASLGLGDFTAAEEHLRRSLQLNPRDSRGLSNLGYANLLNGRYAAAVSAFEQGLVVAPKALNLRVFLGASHYCLGDWPAARQAYESVLQSGDPGEYPQLATGILSLIALREGDPVASRQYWQEAVARGSADVEIFLNWARLEALARHREEALRFIAEARAHGAGNLAELYDDPTFRNLRDDTAFRQLVRPSETR